MTEWDAVHSACFGLICLTVVVTDVMRRKVFNVMIVAALLVQAGFLMADLGDSSLLATRLDAAVTGMVVGFVLLLPLYAFRAMGAGDVKFFAVIGWWLGPMFLLPVFVVASLMAGAHALALGTAGSVWALALRDVGERVVAVIPVPVAWRGAISKETSRKRRGIPYAAYMAVGAVGMLVWQS